MKKERSGGILCGFMYEKMNGKGRAKPEEERIPAARDPREGRDIKGE